MRITRRDLLACGAAAVPILASGSTVHDRDRSSLGLVIHSYAVRGRDPTFAEPVAFFEHARSLGAAGVQIGIGARDDAYADDLRARAEAASMYIEGIAALPGDESDLGRFESEVRSARRAGARVIRTVTLTGRRYETFDSADAFARFAERSLRSLRLAAPVVERHDVRLALENHKDWRADQLIALLDRVGSDSLGVCLDTGNSIALLENPMEVVEALAPRAFTTHFKDMAVEEYDEGFRLAEVPLGAGILDLARVVTVLRGVAPEIRFNLEMITRDPLDVPCLTPGYWTTFADLPGRHLARSLSQVRANEPVEPLEHVSRLTVDEQRRIEEDNNRRSFEFARTRLSL